MGINRIVRKKVVRRLLSNVIIAASGSKLTSSLDLADAKLLAITIRCKYHGSASTGITVYVYTTPDDKNWDTDELTSFEPSFSAGATKQKTVYIDPDAQEMQFKVTNKDTGEVVSNVELWAVTTTEEVENG